METKKIIVGNLKMNMMREDVASYLNIINKEIYSSNVIICPSSIYIPYFLKQRYKVGLQNIFFRSEGAYTGEISPKQASSMGINYSIIGHSERRIYFDETDTDINKKIKEAIKYNLRVIFCIGETLEEKNLLKTEKVLKRQLVNGLREIELDMLDNIVIAYEPVWAIGTNKIPSNSDIENTAIYIKQLVNKLYKYDNIKVLYGGSINEKNITTLNKIKNLDGFLIGGAACDSKKFLKIIEVAVN